MERTIQVGLGDRSYPIAIGAGILERIGASLPTRCPVRRYALISDTKVAELYANRLAEALRRESISVVIFTFSPGEASKHLGTIADLASQLAKAGFDRGDGLIALGGGVTGDIVGFLASIYMRGIPFVQVPTTLLAQVDSSVGGKTGVDLPQGKNLVGTFYQPKAVYIDINVLRTLPHDEFLGGMAEVIKYGAAMDASFFAWLSEHSHAILALDTVLLSDLIRRCCELKAAVVEQDEREGGYRRILNFGHTIGHAVEAASGYRLIHGFAVAIGMRAVATLAVRCGVAQPSVDDAITQLLKSYGLPTDIPASLDRGALHSYLRTDKKSQGGRVFFVLPERIGAVRITDQVSESDLDAVFAQADKR